MPYKSVSAVVISANSVANPTTLTPVLPTRATDDLLVAITSCRSNTATVATPSGWTIWPGFPKRSATASGGSIYVFYKQVVGGEGNPALVWTGVVTATSGDSSQAVIICLDNTNVSSPSDVTPPTAIDASASNPSIPTLTTTTPNCTVIGICMKVSDTAQNGTIANSFTERVDSHTTNGTGHNLYVAERLVASASTATGASTVTMSVGTAAQCLSVAIAVARRVPVTYFGIVNRPTTFGAVVAGDKTIAVRNFNGTTDRVSCAGTGAASFNGAHTIVGIVKLNALTADKGIVSFGNGATNLASLADASTNRIGYYTATELCVPSFSEGIVTGVWYIFAISKAAGTNFARFHVKPLGSGSWDHAAGGSSTIADKASVNTTVDFGRFVDNSGSQDCRIAAAALYTAELTDLAIESIQTTPSMQKLKDLGAVSLWNLNQASVATPVDDIIGAADQSSISGTTVVQDTVPGWDATTPTGGNTFFGASAMAVTFGEVTQASRKTFGVVARATTFGEVTQGVRKTFGVVARATTFGEVTQAVRKTFGQVAMPTSFGAVVQAVRKTFGVVARPTTFGEVTQGSRKTFSTTAMPVTFGAVVSGIRPAPTSFGVVAMATAFGSTTQAQRRTTSSSSMSTAFAATTQARRQTFGQVARPTTFSSTTQGRRQALGSVAVNTVFASTTQGSRKTFGVVARPITFTAVVDGRRLIPGIYGSVSANFAFGSTTQARRKTFSATALSLSVELATQGTRQTFGATSTSTLFGATTQGRLEAFSSSALPVTLTIATKGTVALPVPPITGIVVTQGPLLGAALSNGDQFNVAISTGTPIDVDTEAPVIS